MKAALPLALALAALAPVRAAEPFVSQQEKDYARSNQAAEKSAVATAAVAARELTPRNGLPRFVAKARAGEALTVVYFGGSITAHDGWRPQSFSALQSLFPQARLTMVNAGVGGSGSIVGVFRADRDLVAHRPDLVFIEFAVNDAGDAARRPKDVLRALEGLIRKVRAANPDADFCFVHTMQTANVDTVRRGLAQPAVSVHERVAEYYGLPSVQVGPAVVAEIDAGRAVFFGKVSDAGRDEKGRLVITEDNTHPVIPTGHAFYAQIVSRSLAALAQAPSPAAECRLPSPMFGTSWESARTVPAEGRARFTGNWERLTAATGPACMRFGKRFYEWFPALARTADPGASVTVRFRGTMIGLKGLDGPDSGIVTVTIDGRPPRTENHFTVYNTRWFYVGESQPELPEGEHIATWTLSAEKPDKLRILAARKGNDQDLLAHPEKYEPCTFSVGEITVIGEILPPP